MPDVFASLQSQEESQDICKLACQPVKGTQGKYVNDKCPDHCMKTYGYKKVPKGKYSVKSKIANMKKKFHTGKSGRSWARRHRRARR